MDAREFDDLLNAVRRAGFVEAAESMQKQRNSELWPGDVFVHARSGDRYTLIERYEGERVACRILKL